MKFRNLILIVMLFSLAFSAQGWENNLGEDIVTEPVKFAGNIIVGSDEGTVFALNTETGAKVWEKDNLGDSVHSIHLFNNRILVVLDKGTVYLLKDKGAIDDEIKLNSQVYGVDVTSNMVYITTERGIAEYDGDNIKWLYEEVNSYSAPVYYEGKVYVGKGSELVEINSKGNITWKVKLGPFWKAKPVVYSNTIYIGSMNHYLYAVDVNTGEEEWFLGTSGAITSSVLIHGGSVYIGSNDGYLYSVSASDGELKWKGKTNGGISSVPLASDIGSENVVLAGSDDTYIYGFKRSNGELVWGYSTVNPVNSISLFDNKIFVVSGYYVYFVPTERSCVITDPPDRTKVGYREIEVEGKVFSEYSGASALISVNDGPWEKALTDENGTFAYVLNPNNYFFGAVEVKCKVSDSGGQSSTYSKLILIRSTEFLQPEFELDYPSSVTEGSEILIMVYDKETEEGVKNFDYVINGETYKSEESFVKINSGGAGELNVKFSKPGYIDKTIKVNVEMDLTLYILGGLVVLIIVGLVWFKFSMKK